MAAMSSDPPSAPGQPGERWLTRGVLGIILATFFSDVGHEMVTAVLPFYLVSVGLGPAALGMMEGAADLVFSLAKLGGGVVGHHTARKRPLTAMGYGLTAVTTAAIGLAGSAVAVAALRMTAWIGRGFRSPLRDFLLADEVPASHFGRAYGVERSADMLGAVAGPLLALLLVGLGLSLDSVVLLSIAPALLPVVFILTMTRDRPGAVAAVAAARRSHALPRQFWLLLVGVLLFGLGDFSRTFLIFLAGATFGGAQLAGAAFGGGQPGEMAATGMAMTAGILAYTVHNVVSGLAAMPAGRLSDRWPKRWILCTGYALGAATNALLAAGSSFPALLAVAVLMSGVYIAIEETVEKATVAEILPRELRSLGFGVLACANAVGDMVSSLYVGVLMAAGQSRLAFGLAAVLGVSGAAWIFFAGRGARDASAGPE
jgi:MFS family permease